MKTILPCAVCREFPEAMESDPDTPYGADIFTATGHYGSTRYDPPTGEHLRLLICASCLDRMRAGGLIQRVLHATRDAPGTAVIFGSAEDTDPDNPANRLRIANQDRLDAFLGSRDTALPPRVASGLYAACCQASSDGRTFTPEWTEDAR